MRSLTTLTPALLALAASVSAWTNGHRDLDAYSRQLRARNIVTDSSSLSSSYDFVIVGGGTAGLALASRLSEDSNTTVLVLEAGDTGDAVAASINIPGDAYYSGIVGSQYDWNYALVPQVTANNRQLWWPRGKVLGGSSAMNGLYMVRPSSYEMDVWSNLISSADSVGAKAWNWENMLNAMKKSETFTSPASNVATEAEITYATSSHGTDGPIQVTWPGYTFDFVGDWTPTLEANGIPQNSDPDDGSNSGVFVATSCINPSNWTRSYSRSAYIDPLPPRNNLAVLPNAFVTQINWTKSDDGNLTANSVSYAATEAAAAQSVGVNKEVILSAGAIGSPAVLMYSGVGPEDVLQAAGVSVNLALPAVGQHLQDHISTELIYSTNNDTAKSLKDAGDSDSAFLSFVNSATAYINISQLVSDPTSFQSEISQNLSTAVSTLVPSSDSTVQAGYKAIYDANLNDLMMQDVGQMEILLSLTGTSDGDKTVAIQAALQRPFSQGRIYINSSNPWQAPLIDPQYLSHEADVIMLREGLKLARRVGQSQPLSNYLTGELSPGSSVSSDADWETWAANTIGTEYHPSCTCAMLPQDQGGVVDANLKVYGTKNVRVVDASVFPIEFSAHLQAPVYGLAEQAATIIRAQYNGVTLPWASTTTTSSSSSASSTAPGDNNSTSSASSLHPAISLIASLGIAILAGLFAI